MCSWFSEVYKRYWKIDSVNPNVPGWPSYWLGIGYPTGKFWKMVDNAYWSMRSLYYRYRRWQDMRHYHHPDPEVRDRYARKVMDEVHRRADKRNKRQEKKG